MSVSYLSVSILLFSQKNAALAIGARRGRYGVVKQLLDVGANANAKAHSVCLVNIHFLM